MGMDAEFQFAYWSALVQQEQIGIHETAWRPWVPNFKTGSDQGVTGVESEEM